MPWCFRATECPSPYCPDMGRRVEWGGAFYFSRILHYVYLKQAAGTSPFKRVCVCVCVIKKVLDQMSAFLFRAGRKFHSMKGNQMDSTSISTPRGWLVTHFLWSRPREGTPRQAWDGPWLARECLLWCPWSVPTFEFCPFSTPGSSVPPGPSVWL